MATIEVTLAVTAAEVAVTMVTANGAQVGLKNPHAAEPKDTVTWVFNPGLDNQQVVFTGVQLPNASGGLDQSEPINEQGPFYEPLSRSGNAISGTIAPDAPCGRYLYEIRDGNDNPLDWPTRLMPTGENFGGLDIPKTPPGG